MKHKHRSKYIIDIPIYSQELEVYFTRKKFMRRIKELGIEESISPHRLIISESLTCFTDSNGYYYAILRLSKRTKASTLAHEMVHVAYRLLGVVGVKLEPENHEALAYLVGYLVRSYYEMMGHETPLIR